ncbi:hypothetical protein HK098_000108 [Nowakowskiella sp. JEL0407]|nr:hypothetical protein HK098_000108 [Nowakowskiella sp. JEL0407]
MKFSASIIALVIAASTVFAQGYDSGPVASPAAAAPSSTAAASSGASNTFTSTSKKFAVAAAVDGTDAVFALWTPGSNVTGWLGIGIGNAMAGADIYLAWFANNTARVSDRTGTGHVLPGADAQQQVKVLTTIPTALSAYVPAGYTPVKENVIVFSRPLTPVNNVDKTLSATEATGFIWAYNPNKPVNGVFAQHTEYGKIPALALTPNAAGGGSNTAAGGKTGGAGNIKALTGTLVTLIVVAISALFV